MNKTAKTSIGILLLIAVALMFTCLFTISEGQHAMILRLGRLVKNDSGQALILAPGLHVKAPFIDRVYLLDTRVQTLDIKSSRIVTKEKKDVMVDYYAKWRVKNMDQYFRATGGNSMKALNLLEQQLNTLIRAEFGKRTIPDLVSGERGDVMKVLLQQAVKQASELGIEVVDVRIKGIELPASTSNAIYQRMRANMQKLANSHRAEGSAKAEALRAEADAKVAIILASAQSEGQKTRAQGEAQAAEVYAKAFGQNKVFFAFYRSLLAYEASFTNKQDILVLDQSSSFFDYFKHGISKKDSQTGKK